MTSLLWEVPALKFPLTLEPVSSYAKLESRSLWAVPWTEQWVPSLLSRQRVWGMGLLGVKPGIEFAYLEREVARHFKHSRKQREL